MVFIWGLLAFGAIAAASSAERRRGGQFILGVLFAAIFVVFFVLAGLDNAKSDVVDCRTVVDPNTGGDVLSCAQEHWLPTGVWRAINRF